MIDSAAEKGEGPPEGFVAYSEPSAFLDRIGPLFQKVEHEGLVIGMRVLTHHCNRPGLLHGACLAAMCDIVFGKTLARFSKPPASINLNIDYMSAARGRVVGGPRRLLAGRQDGCERQRLCTEGATVIARANATFAIARPDRVESRRRRCMEHEQTVFATSCWVHSGRGARMRMPYALARAAQRRDWDQLVDDADAVGDVSHAASERGSDRSEEAL
jgi:acyl-coenzyme A thioesterase PaaI-like protein